jgi:hypothetical protein
MRRVAVRVLSLLVWRVAIRDLIAVSRMRSVAGSVMGVYGDRRIACNLRPRILSRLHWVGHAGHA